MYVIASQFATAQNLPPSHYWTNANVIISISKFEFISLKEPIRKFPAFTSHLQIPQEHKLFFLIDPYFSTLHPCYHHILSVQMCYMDFYFLTIVYHVIFFFLFFFLIYFLLFVVERQLIVWSLESSNCPFISPHTHTHPPPTPHTLYSC